MSELLNDGLNKVLFDAIPSIVLVVDDDVRILDYNHAALAILGSNRESVFRVRGGEALHCIHSYEVPEGCGGAAACKNCVIRNSVKKAIAGNATVRHRTKMEIDHDGKTDEIFAMISASPFEYDGSRLVLLIIEDISDLVRLQRVMPICMSCKKIRTDEQYWTEVATYLHANLDMEFTHGFCPECAEKEFAKLKDTTDKT